jgi:hypothetical protein
MSEFSVTKYLRDLPKPYPYHRAMAELLERSGRPVGQISSTMNALASNSGAHSVACSGKHVYSFMDGMLAMPTERCSATHPHLTNVVVTRKEKLHGRYLVLMPCNSGAMTGDYFTKNTWQTASKYFPERMNCVDFAATDSIVTVSKDGKGLIVFENEMDRVRGFDLFPSFSEGKLLECKEAMRVSAPRLAHYEKVFVYLNVRLYKESVLSSLLPNMVVIDLVYKQGPFLQKMPELRAAFEQHADPSCIL